MNSYDASGRKLAARNFTNVVALSQPLNEGEVLKHVVDENERVYISSVHNIDNVEYNSLTTYNFSTASTVESIQFSKLYNSEGYVAESSNSTSSQLTNPEYYYFCRDHLGNIREVWRGNRRTVVQRTQYYPSGLPWAKNSGDDTELPANANNRKYNGKEFVEMHGLDEYDSEARWYYPAIMRTTTIDPLAEKYYSISPYAWCGNNPVLMVDPDGRDPRKIGDWIKFGSAVYKATTAVVTLGFQGSIKSNAGNYAVGAVSNAGSFDLIGIRDGKFTPNRYAPTTQSGVEIALGVVSLSKSTIVKDNGPTTTKTETSALGVTVVNGSSVVTTETDEKTNEIISKDTKNDVDVTDMGYNASFIIGIEVKFDMKMIENALRKLIHE